jgi:hypothetical protein
MHVSGRIHDPAALIQREAHVCLPSRRLGGTQNCSGRFGELKNAMPFPGFEKWIFQPEADCYT